MAQKIVFGVGLIMLVLFFQRTKMAGLSEIRHLSAFDIALILSLNFPVLLVKSWRWKYLLARLGLKLSGRRLFRAVSSGFYLGLVSPGTIGELARVLALTDGRKQALLTVGVEKSMDLAVLVLLAAMGGMFLLLPEAGTLAPAVLATLIVAGFFSFIYRSKNLRAFISKRVEKRLGLKGEEIDDIARRLTGKPPFLFSLLASGVLWLIPAIQFFLIFRALETGIHFRGVVISLFGPYLLGVISMVPLGIGVFELSTAQIVALTATSSPETAHGGILLFRGLTILPLILIGLACAAGEAFSRK